MLNALNKTTQMKKKRLGQGHGSGRVKTSGRGTKGQNARSSRSLSFEGGALPLIKRLPFRRGKGRNRAFKLRPLIINVKALAHLKKDTVVDLEGLIKNHIVLEKDAKMYGVKILGDGDLDVSLTVKLPVSKGARKKIEKAGGKVDLPAGKAEI